MSAEIAAIEAAAANFLPALGEIGGAGAINNAHAAAGQNFGSMLVAGIQNLDDAVQAADTAVADFALGADLPPHQVMLAMEKARMDLQFALQVRSRLVEGYQELMRMQL